MPETHLVSKSQYRSAGEEQLAVIVRANQELESSPAVVQP